LDRGAIEAGEMRAADSDPAREPTESTFARRIIRALPPICDVRRGALIWAIAMALSCWAGFWFFYDGISGKKATLEALFFMAGLVAWPFGLFGARLLALGKGALARFAASFASLFIMTVGFTALFFSQQYRSFYAQWHQPILSRIGIHQFVDTSASAVAQFLALGVRLYFPLGLVIFILASLWLMRRMR
jgi:hypothetical protein